jgi:hypothetical protein
VIARRKHRRLRRVLVDAAWSTALFIVLFSIGLMFGTVITGRHGW